MRGGGAPDVPVPAALPAGPITLTDARGGPGLRVQRLLVEPGQEPVVVVGDRRHLVSGVVVGVSLAEHERILRRLLLVQAVMFLLLVGTAAVAVRWVVGRGLRPLEHVATTARAVAAGDVARRVPEQDLGTEVGAVAAALNEALDRLRDSELRVRGLMADASHELRTPLAAPLRREPVDLAPLARDVVSAVRLLSAAHDVQLREPPDGCAVAVADAAGVRQVLANLLTNALRHTPPGTRVRVDVDAGVASAGGGERDGPDRRVTLVVADDGPGLTAEQRGLATGRFWRAAPAPASTSASVSPRAQAPLPPHAQAGSGLGLAIVHDLVAAQDGTLSLDEAPEGGLRVTVTWPAAPGEVRGAR